MTWSCRVAKAADLGGVYALFAACRAFPDAAGERDVELRLWSVWKRTGWSPLNQVLALEDGTDRVLGALCFFPTGERGVALEPPRLLPGADVEPAAFLKAALDVLGPRFGYAQALLDAEDPAFTAAGLPVAARLLTLERPARPGDDATPIDPALAWRTADAVAPGNLEDLIRRTLVGSLDAPAVQEILTPDEMLASYRAPGPRWFQAEAGGKPVACLLLNALEDGGLELKYMGVVPEARGRGFGRALLARAVREDAQIAVTVDETNAPARSLYAAYGFETRTRKFLPFASLARYHPRPS